MNFEKITAQPDRNFTQEVSSLSQEAARLLTEASPEDRATYASLRQLERKFFRETN